MLRNPLWATVPSLQAPTTNSYDIESAIQGPLMCEIKNPLITTKEVSYGLRVGPSKQTFNCFQDTKRCTRTRGNASFINFINLLLLLEWEPRQSEQTNEPTKHYLARYRETVAVAATVVVRATTTGVPTSEHGCEMVG